MVHIIVKEFNCFFNSLIAYLVIGVFLVAMGLLLWVFPESSVLDYGFADLSSFFSLSPYVFIFLIPAITMRSFAEEMKSGTLELLCTKPLSDWQIILGKYFACFILVFLALVPTATYYFSVYQLGNPIGNIDTAGVMGSYIGLILLAGVFCSVGMLASSLTNNQLVAFIFAAFFCFFIFMGLDSMSTLAVGSDLILLVKQLGLLYHYNA
ncbi:MAG: ABC transporter permease, partial [Flammeovirgaceae bacterium]|nr:ABC transporter permease [Flammeovirgaceae bacterium]